MTTGWANPNNRSPVYALLRELVTHAHIEVHGVLTAYMLEQLHALEFLDMADSLCRNDAFWAQVPATYVNRASKEVTREETRATLRELVDACR